MKKRISIIIPIYNEEKNILVVYEALHNTLRPFEKRYIIELLFINDGSKDNSWRLIESLSQQDKRIKGVSFSRNFGYQMALTAGHDYAQGDAVITIDADLQDPPELIAEMICKWEAGFSIVYARRIARNDGFLKDFTASVFYKILSLVSEINIPSNVGDFRLLDKKVVFEIKKCRETSRYWRGMVAWSGFKSTFIEFKRPERLAGETGYTWFKLIHLAFDGLTSYSLMPLKIAAFVGVFVIGTGLFMLLYIMRDVVMYQARYPLFKWLTTIIYIFTGVQFLLTWLVGEYIGRIYMQQKNRPLYIIDEMIGERVNENNARQNRSLQRCMCNL